MSDILHVDFISGSQRKVFQVDLRSYYPLESGGILWSNTFNLELSNEFYALWGYVKKRYGIVGDIQVDSPVSATIEQKRESIDSKGYPWIHRLIVKDETNSEVCLFYPYICDLLNNIEQEENETNEQ